MGAYQNLINQLQAAGFRIDLADEVETHFYVSWKRSDAAENILEACGYKQRVDMPGDYTLLGEELAVWWPDYGDWLVVYKVGDECVNACVRCGEPLIE